MTALGRKIEELLAARGWNQARLADEHPDLQRSTVSRVISGKNKPDLETLDAIATTLDAPIEVLLQAALYDLTGEERQISLDRDDAARVAALVRSFDWLTPVVEQLADLPPGERDWLLAWLEVQGRMRRQRDDRD